MHPYKTLPTSAFWNKSVASNFSEGHLVSGQNPVIRSDDLVATAGSCFAANIAPYLTKAGINFLKTEYVNDLHNIMGGDSFAYHKFSAAYGNIYTPRQLLQLLRRCNRTFIPKQDRFHDGDKVIDMFRPGLKWPASSAAEFDLLQAKHFNCTLEALRSCTVFIFTLGLTESWISSEDGAVYPSCPGTIAGEFDPTRHVFHNMTYPEILEDLEAFRAELRQINPTARILLTVSPVPLVATATSEHVLTATIYSKSVLRAAAGQFATSHDDVAYFPAYEIITGPQAPYSFFEDDRRTPSKEGIDAVMSALFRTRFDDKEPVPETRVSHNALQSIFDRECEEATVE